MKEYPTFAEGMAQDGKIMFSDAQRKTINDYVFKHEGQYIRLTLSQPTKPRSNNQNAYMWGVVYAMIAAETGHTAEEVHEFMKAKFLPRAFITIGNEEIQLTKSTTALSTMQMEEYLDNIRSFAATELNMEIPLPQHL